MAHSFYWPRASGLHALHPLTKLTLVAAILLVGFAARTSVVPLALLSFVVLPLAVWGRIARGLVQTTLTVIVPFVISIVLVQGWFYPGPSSVLWTLGPLTLKEQGLWFAYATAARILLLSGAGLLLLFSTSPGDLTLALEQRGLPSALGYIVMAALQLLPQMQARALAILDAQRARGLESEGGLFVRTRALVPLLAPLIYSTLGEVDERAMALEARGFSVPRVKTSFRELRDTRLQAAGRWLLLAGALAVSAAEVLAV